MAKQMTIDELSRHRQPPSRAVIIIKLRWLAKSLRIPREGSPMHNELVRTFGERSWNDEHLHSAAVWLARNKFDQPLTPELIAEATRETLPAGANRSLGCTDCNETGWRSVKSRGGITGVERCTCVQTGKQQELALA